MNGEILEFAGSRLDVREQVRKSVRLHRREAVVKDRYFAVILSSCGLSQVAEATNGVRGRIGQETRLVLCGKPIGLGTILFRLCRSQRRAGGLFDMPLERAFTAVRQRFLDRVDASRGM